MKCLKLLIVCCLMGATASAQSISYTRTDSLRVVHLLKLGHKQPADTNFMLFYARQLKGLPYVAQTLEIHANERLVINLRQLDCTTYVENVLALTRCAKHGQERFEDFCHCLQKIRYEDNQVHYTHRLHYFSEWIADNERIGLVKEVQTPNPPFTAQQQIKVDFMSTHAEKYPMLVQHPEWISPIAQREQKVNALTPRYIPTQAISNTPVCRDAIHDGDILALVTNKPGLDISHVGIAVWHKDGLHLLNASLLQKRVVEDKQLLADYLRKRGAQLGIRVVRAL
ncbi:MAG: N-acetylmuramoyl-L-alanine amidase-like domain-containing protein [Segatella oulorum]